MVDFQSYDYHFPMKAFVGIFWFKTLKDNKLMILPMSTVKTNKNDLVKYGKEFEKAFMKRSSHIEAIDHLLVLPITFDRLVPLKRKYWEKPGIENDIYSLIHEYIQVIGKSGLYELLVVPRQKYGKKEQYSAATPVKVGTTLEDIENFMLSSTEVVDPLAKNAAIYKIQKPYSLNYKTGEVFIKGITKEEEALHEVGVN